MAQNADQYPQKESIAEIAQHGLLHRRKNNPSKIYQSQTLKQTKRAAAPPISGSQSSGMDMSAPIFFGKSPATEGDTRHINH